MATYHKAKSFLCVKRGASSGWIERKKGIGRMRAVGDGEQEYEVGPQGGEVEFACPHCGESIKLVITREERGTGRNILPMTQTDVEQIQQMRRES